MVAENYYITGTSFPANLEKQWQPSMQQIFLRQHASGAITKSNILVFFVIVVQHLTFLVMVGAGSGIVRIDLFLFLAGCCRKRRLNQALSIFLSQCSFHCDVY